ncbi:alpha-2-macroglobulin receptor-associated protein [Daktulosphaira vitifoliae]|uniref:alpha-2-macroglobulin receptor-associated protein n=1 Tax=Daktulosphaira vitifoliae TaxID=58002 RepID=UPI0021AA7FB0|nr:alpha-2-macroglobulin receptor-associated protein [Daktulosphaira vitifoliae]
MRGSILLLKILLLYSLFIHVNTNSVENETLKKRISLKSEPDFNVRHLNKPFKINKLNLVWSKAKQKCSEPELRSLLSEMRIQDEDERELKLYKSKNMDKDGEMESIVRKKLLGILQRYKLSYHFENNEEPQINESYFDIQERVPKDSSIVVDKYLLHDKRLNQLWSQAKQSGFTSIELIALKEEFLDHQKKIDEYYSLINEVEHMQNDIPIALSQRGIKDDHNSLHDTDDVSKFNIKQRELENRIRDIKDSFDRLHRLSLTGPNSNEFVEPKVQEIWLKAQKSNFDKDELELLHDELKEYERRLLKLRHLNVDLAAGNGNEHPGGVEKKIKKESRSVQKLHKTIEDKIANRKEEL